MTTGSLFWRVMMMVALKDDKIFSYESGLGFNTKKFTDFEIEDDLAEVILPEQLDDLNRKIAEYDRINQECVGAYMGAVPAIVYTR